MSPQLLLVLLGVFLSVLLAAWAIGTTTLDWLTPEQREIRKLSQGRSDVLAELQLTELPSPWVKRFQQVVPKSPKEMSALRRRMTAAGYTGMAPAVLYSAAEIILPVVGGIVGFLYFGMSQWYYALFVAGFAFVLPSLWLGRRTKQRQKMIRNGLPDALDLMIVCIESGSSVDQAIIKTSDELDISHPALAEELRLITT